MSQPTFNNPLNEDDLQWKKTSNGRRPQNIKSGISQKLLIGSYSNLNFSLDDQIIFYNSEKRRKPPMDDDINILKVEYLSNTLLDHNQILNFLDDQTIFYKSLKWRQTPMEDDLSGKY